MNQPQQQQQQPPQQLSMHERMAQAQGGAPAQPLPGQAPAGAPAPMNMLPPDQAPASLPGAPAHAMPAGAPVGAPAPQGAPTALPGATGAFPPQQPMQGQPGALPGVPPQGYAPEVGPNPPESGTAPAPAAGEETADKPKGRGRPAGSKNKTLNVEQQVYMLGVSAIIGHPSFDPSQGTAAALIEGAGELALAAFKKKFG